MEQPKNDKPRNGQSVAFYTALAVCLIAVGVGTWQLLRPEEASSAVSGAASLPTEMPDVTVRVAGPDADPEPDAESEPEDVTALKPATKPDEEQAAPSAPDTKPSASEGDKAASDKKSSASDGSKTASNKKPSASDGSKTTSDKKPSASDGSKAASDASKGSKTASDTKQTASGGKSGDGVRPVEGETVTGFSMDKLLYNETMRDWRTHDGIDIAADAGTAVAAAKAGTVESVETDPIMGTTVTIRHEGPWESVYSSLTDMPEVEAGDAVIAGQVIGYVGESAASEAALGPPLHFTVLNDGSPTDPETFLS